MAINMLKMAPYLRLYFIKGNNERLLMDWRSLRATFGRRFWTEALKDVLFAAGVVIVIMGLLYAYTGTWPPFVTVDGQSMLPNMRQNDLVIIKGLDRAGVNTYNLSLPARLPDLQRLRRRDRVPALRRPDEDAGHPPRHVLRERRRAHVARRPSVAARRVRHAG